MATMTESKTIEKTAQVRDVQAELHNAQIRERFRALQQAEESQFKSVFGESGAEHIRAPQATVLTPERPTTQERTHTDLFTTATLDRVIERNATTAEKSVAAGASVQMESAAVVEDFTISRFAKVVAAVFATAVVAMLTIICVNTQVIRQKGERLNQLQAEKAQISQEYAEVLSDIEQAKSEETIRAFADAYNAQFAGK